MYSYKCTLNLSRKTVALRTGVRKVAQVSNFDDGHVAEISIQDEDALLRDTLQHEHSVQERIVEGLQAEKPCTSMQMHEYTIRV